VFCSNLGVCLDNLNLVSQLKNHAYRDQLLSLPNRLRFIEQIDTVLKEGTAAQVVALLDIDDFAEMNDVLGHHYGDLLLQSIARRLGSELGEQVFLARISGDVFGLLGPANYCSRKTCGNCLLNRFRLKKPSIPLPAPSAWSVSAKAAAAVRIF
jgi:GGDEF domain-containing protein